LRRGFCLRQYRLITSKDTSDHHELFLVTLAQNVDQSLP
jgi:hypothetical protein